MKRTSTVLVLAVISLSVGGCPPMNSEETQLMSFIETHVATIRPLTREAHLDYWEAAVSGDAAAYKRVSDLELRIRRIYSDAGDYARLKALRASGRVRHPLLTRQLDLLINSYLEIKRKARI